MKSQLHLRSLLLLLLPLFVLSCEKEPIVADSSDADLLKQMVDIAAEHSINKHTIDWVMLETEVLDKLASGSFGGAVHHFLGRLGDHHSFFEYATGQRLYHSDVHCEGELVGVNYRSSDIGYVRVGAFSGSNAEALVFAQAIQEEIAAKDTSSLVGWIVDLRGNTGGNMYPMITGLGPILGENELGFFLDADSMLIPWGYHNGGAYYNTPGTSFYELEDPYQLLNPDPKVAVLTDGRTASSGEAVAISFRQRADTRSFGEPTCGLSTGNRAFALYDGHRLFLTSSTMVDRSGQVYGGQVAPDEVIDEMPLVLPRAIEWLRE